MTKRGEDEGNVEDSATGASLGVATKLPPRRPCYSRQLFFQSSLKLERTILMHAMCHSTNGHE